MYIYDKAHELAKVLAESPEFKTLKTAKQKIDADSKAKEMLNDFKKKQFELHNLQMMGQKIDDEKMSQIQGLYQVIMMNPDISEYLGAEIKFSQIFSDVYKIIGEAVEIDLDFMK